MTPDQESAYVRGQRALALRWLRQIIREELGPDAPEASAERWRLEREEAIAKLREICDRHGDNDWPNDLHLADIIDKHLLRHLEAK